MRGTVLNQRWIDVPAIQWYDNAEFVSFATSRALAYFFPSIIRLSYLEEITNVKRYMSDTREWMMNTLTGIDFWEKKSLGGQRPQEISMIRIPKINSI